MTLYACPKCADENNLLISAETTVLLVQTDDEYETEVINRWHWWDENSYMACRSCGWDGCTDDAFKENKVRN